MDFPKKKTIVVPISSVPFAPLKLYSKCLSLHIFIFFFSSSFHPNEIGEHLLYYVCESHLWMFLYTNTNTNYNFDFGYRYLLCIGLYMWIQNCKVNCFCLALAFFRLLECYECVRNFFFGLTNNSFVFWGNIFSAVIDAYVYMCMLLYLCVCEIWKPFNIWVNEWNIFRFHFIETVGCLF